jgi:ankyrin repeat protein
MTDPCRAFLRDPTRDPLSGVSFTTRDPLNGTSLIYNQSLYDDWVQLCGSPDISGTSSVSEIPPIARSSARPPIARSSARPPIARSSARPPISRSSVRSSIARPFTRSTVRSPEIQTVQRRSTLRAPSSEARNEPRTSESTGSTSGISIVQHHPPNIGRSTRNHIPESSDLSLIDAVSEGDIDLIKSLIDRGVDLNIRNNLGNTALLIAINLNNSEIAKMLLDAGANPNVGRMAPLSIAIRDDHKEIVRMLIDAGANLNMKGTGYAPLLRAVRDNRPEIVQMLLNAKPVDKFDLNVNDISGNTLLMIAVTNNNINTVTMLLDAGADPNIKNHLDSSPLMLAMINEHYDMAISLLAHGADPNIKNLASEPLLFKAVRNNNIDLVKAFIAAHVDIDATNIHGYTALVVAVHRNYSGIVKLLIDAKANVNISNPSGDTLLMVAAVNDSIPIVDTLINANVDLNAVNNLGSTALILALDKRQFPVAKSLIGAGADVNIQNNDGVTALIIAAGHGNTEIVQLLLTVNANLNAQTKNGYTALISAAINHHPLIAELLIGAGADLNIRNAEGDTAIMVSSLNITDMLLEAKADVTIRNHNGETMLMNASTPLIAQELIDRGANIDAQDNFGSTALMHRFTYYPQVAIVLINNGADVTIENEDGVSIMDLAPSYDPEITKLLENAEAKIKHRINAEIFGKYREVLNTMNLCDYNSLTPVVATEGLYELCLHENCDFYLKVFNLGSSERLEKLTVELDKLQKTLGPELATLKQSLENLTEDNITDEDLSEANEVIKRDRDADLADDSVDNATVPDLVVLTKGDLLTKQRSQIERRRFIVNAPLQRTNGILRRMRGDFDDRRKDLDVIESLECEHEGTTKGILVVPKSWGYLQCTNPESLITFDSWGDVENKHPVKIFTYNSELNKHSGLTCFNYENLIKYMRDGTKLRDWVRNNPNTSIEEGTGHGGGPGDIKIRKMPDGSHILRRSLNILDDSHKYYAIIPIYLHMLVGNEDGMFGSSMSHGQQPVTVYRLFKADENGLLIDTPPFDSWAMNPSIIRDTIAAISV